MIKFNVSGLDHKALNEKIREGGNSVTISHCCGQRFIASGMSGLKLTIDGTPGNALGAYLNGAEIRVNGNAQDAVGDTMNGGKIIIHGSAGDAVGYAMRGGAIYIKENAGYRAGIHMKEYKDKCPVIVIGGHCGSFLGEYQAGGIIVVLGLGEKHAVGDFPCTGMHGGKVFIRSDCSDVAFPKNVTASRASAEELSEIEPYIAEFCKKFGYEKSEIMSSLFTKVIPDSNNPYKQMYVAN